MSTLLIVEDGHEYTESFARLGGPDAPRLIRAGSLAEAEALLDIERPDGLFLDVVFDRSPIATLAGDLASRIDRFGGDRTRAVRHLQENQGFYILDVLAPRLPDGMPVVIAYDFSAEPQRFAALKSRVSGLSGLPDGASISLALELLRRPSMG